MNRVVIGVGSNVTPEKNIPRARDCLRAEFTVLAESDFIETEPIGIAGQPNFINGAVLIKTELGEAELKKKLLKIEHSLGRTRFSDKYAPRTIDLDILVWNNEILDTDVFERGYLKDSIIQLLPDIHIE